jgi:hypothetical protein
MTRANLTATGCTVQVRDQQRYILGWDQEWFTWVKVHVMLVAY